MLLRETALTISVHQIPKIHRMEKVQKANHQFQVLPLKERSEGEIVQVSLQIKEEDSLT